MNLNVTQFHADMLVFVSQWWFYRGGMGWPQKSLVPPLKPPQMKIWTLVLSLHSVYMKTFGATPSTSNATPWATPDTNM